MSMSHLSFLDRLLLADCGWSPPGEGLASVGALELADERALMLALSDSRTALRYTCTLPRLMPLRTSLSLMLPVYSPVRGSSQKTSKVHSMPGATPLSDEG